MVINNNIHANVDRITKNHGTIPDNKLRRSNEPKFGNVLKTVTENTKIKFSKHAEMRLQMRNISFTDIQKEKISKAVMRAEEKGVKESLVVVDDVALVVNIKNKTVITAVNSNELKENVFTNIDGAVFA
jgi:flagellar operon protein